MPDGLRPVTGSVSRERAHSVGVAALVCGILALVLLSLLYGPVSTGSVAIGIVDIAVLMIMTTVLDRNRAG